MTVSVSTFDVTVLLPCIAVAVAVLTIDPASRSACVTVWLAVQVIDPPTASGVGVCGQLTVALSSVTAYGVTNGTLPLFVTR